MNSVLHLGQKAQLCSECKSIIEFQVRFVEHNTFYLYNLYSERVKYF